MILRKSCLILLALFASIPVSFGAESGFEPYIIGGKEVSDADPIARSTVLIRGETLVDGKLSQYVCSGSVIAPDIILTAAHCVADDPAHPVQSDKLKVVFGVHGNDPMAESRMVVGYEVHPGWSRDIQHSDAHDIAVIRIREGVPQGFGPATLPNRRLVLSRGTHVVLAGYGVTDGIHPAFSTTGTLREVSVDVFGPYGATEVLVDESHQKASCGGDSGGPAFVEVNGALVLWGLTSRGDTSCSTEGVYTRVDSYFDFLNWAINRLHQLP